MCADWSIPLLGAAHLNVERCLPIGCGQYFVARRFEIRSDQLADVWLVIYDENKRFLGHCCAPYPEIRSGEACGRTK